MAGETAEQWNNWIDSIKNDLTWLWDKIKNWWHDLMKKIWLEKEEATQETISDSQKKLDDLAKKLVDIELNKLNDKEIDMEWNIDNLNDETTILWLLAKNNENIKSWFERLKDIDDEDIRSREIEQILLSLREISNNDTDNTKIDLTEQELKEIWEQSKKKMDLCNEVLSSDELKSLPEDKKTKKSIIKACNDILSETEINWDISKIKKEDIINKLNQIEQWND